MSPLVKLENINKIFQLGDHTFTALKDVQFELMRGELTAIIGASGSGKSTLMNIIGFLDRPTSGKYYFNGEDVSSLSDEQLAIIRNQKIGFVFQSFFLLPRSTLLENIMLPLFYRGTPIEEAKQLAITMMEKLDIAHLAHHKPNQASGGQQQRVAIARALVGNPEIILADEPTGALDSKNGQDVMRLLIDLNEQENRTVLIITHDKDVSKMCKRVITIQDGEIKPQMHLLTG